MELFLSDNLQPASTKVLSRPFHVFTSSRRQIYTRLVSNDSQVYRVNDYSGGSIRALPSSIPDSRLLLETSRPRGGRGIGGVEKAREIPANGTERDVESGVEREWWGKKEHKEERAWRAFRHRCWRVCASPPPPRYSVHVHVRSSGAVRKREGGTTRRE